VARPFVRVPPLRFSGCRMVRLRSPQVVRPRRAEWGAPTEGVGVNAQRAALATGEIADLKFEISQ
jgi:hypothetical protein